MRARKFARGDAKGHSLLCRGPVYAKATPGTVKPTRCLSAIAKGDGWRNRKNKFLIKKKKIAHKNNAN
jgi:hypothetical protein